MLPPSVLLTASGLFAMYAAAKQKACAAGSIPHPEVFGTKILSVDAQEVKNYQITPVAYMGYNVPFEMKPLDFCNVTITYTHEGLNDLIHAYVWLPLEGWNGNLLAMGGGGWSAGFEGGLAPSIANGYAGANTDAGHTFHTPESSATAASWALTAPGVVDWVALQNFASIAVDDLTHISKAVIESFYGKAPKYSYWNGCSTGGRQGLMNAQRFPTNYDGIVAAAPANNWVTFLVTEFWGQLLMKKKNHYPPPCEFQAIQQAAIEACDELDGVKDGVIAAVNLCKFDANKVVGQSCCGGAKKISIGAAEIVNKLYEGPRHSKKSRKEKTEWFGFTHEMPFTANMPGTVFNGLMMTECPEGEVKGCQPSPFPVSLEWIRLFLAKDPNYDPMEMTEDEFFDFLHMSRQRYHSIMDTADPNLAAFKANGGKMITWHGLADELIFPNGTANYYERVLDLDPKAHDFFRYFEVPGVQHCLGGPGAQPHGIFQSLVDWVEKGKAPDSVDAATMPMAEGQIAKERILCPYPKVASYIGGNPNLKSSFECAETFGTKKAPHTEAETEHTEL